MTSRVSYTVVFKKHVVTEALAQPDKLGTDVLFMNSDKDHGELYTRVNERAIFQFAKNYAPDVLVLSPDSLVEKLREDAKKVVEAYK